MKKIMTSLLLAIVLGGLIFIGYKLDAGRHAGIRAALEARDSEAADAVLIAPAETP